MSDPSILESLVPSDEFEMIWPRTHEAIKRKGYVLRRPPGARSAMLGEGAFAAVFYAEHAQDRTPVAIKIFRDEEEITLASFRREVTMLRALDFPKQCAIAAHDSWHEPGAQPFIVEEYLRGPPIDEYCSQRKLSCASRIPLLEEVFRSLQVLHDHNIQHRDVSAANILIDHWGHARFLDFGLAAEIVRVTVRSTVAARGAYAPGEVKYGNKQADPKDDIFAGGMVAIHVLTDKVPPENVSNSGDPQHLAACRQRLKDCGIDRNLSDLLLRCLQTPELRYAKASDVADALFDYRVLAPARMRTRRVFVASVVLFPCLGAGGWWLYSKTQQEQLDAAYEELKKEVEAKRCTDRVPVSRLIVQAERKRNEAEVLRKKGEVKSAFAALAEGVDALQRASDVSDVLLNVDAYHNQLIGGKWNERDFPAVVSRKQAIEDGCRQVDKLLNQGDSEAIKNATQVNEQIGRTLTELYLVNDVAKLRAAYEDHFQAHIPSSLEKYPQVVAIIERQRQAEENWDSAQATDDWNQTMQLYGQAKQMLDDFLRPVNSIGMALRLILPGSFKMGSSKEEVDLVAKEFKIDPYYLKREVPQHEVEITKPYWLGECEVTVGQFRQFVKATGYKTDAEQGDAGAAAWDGLEYSYEKGRNWEHPDFPQTEQHPVVCVSYKDASKFCEWLSEKEGKPYALPTEAQWEFACRAGTESRFPFGDNVQELIKHGNAADGTLKAKLGWSTLITGQDSYVYTAPVGSFEPNAWGLRDMLGNVGEWTKDWFGEYDVKSPSVDPTGPAEPGPDSPRVIRGGGWTGNGEDCRPAYRHRSTPAGRIDCLGFRVAQGLSSE